MNWFCFIVGGCGVFLVGYFLGRQHEWEEQQGKRDERLDGTEQHVAGLEFQLVMSQFLLNQKVHQNMKLRQTLLEKKLEELRT